MYPAEIRSTGLAVNSFGARVAGILSPWVLSLVGVKSWLPGAIFTVLGVVSGSLAFLLPETLDQPLLTTLDEAEKFYQGESGDDLKQGGIGVDGCVDVGVENTGFG